MYVLVYLYYTNNTLYKFSLIFPHRPLFASSNEINFLSGKLFRQWQRGNFESYQILLAWFLGNIQIVFSATKKTKTNFRSIN